MTEPPSLPMTRSARLRLRLASVVRSPWLYAGLISFGIGAALLVWMINKVSVAPMDDWLQPMAMILVVVPAIAFCGVLAHLNNALTLDPNAPEEPWYSKNFWAEPDWPKPAVPHVPSAFEQLFESIFGFVGGLLAFALAIAVTLLVVGGIAGLLLIGWRALLG